MVTTIKIQKSDSQPFIILPTLVNGQDMIIGATGNIQSSHGILKSLSIGKASMEDVQVIIFDLFTPINQAVSANVHGILGYNFLHNFNLIIDYPMGYLGFL